VYREGAETILFYYALAGQAEATAMLMFYLAFSFAGTGILELQEAGWVPITPISGVPRVTWLGLFPTLETLLAQGIVLLPLGLTAIWRSHQRQAAASV
jgi:high-affinity iron transporter